MYYLRKKIPGSNKTKRLRKKRDKYIDFLRDMAVLMSLTIKAPYQEWTIENQKLMYKYKKQYIKHTREIINQL